MERLLDVEKFNLFTGGKSFVGRLIEDRHGNRWGEIEGMGAVLLSVPLLRSDRLQPAPIRKGESFSQSALRHLQDPDEWLLIPGIKYARGGIETRHNAAQRVV